MFLHRTMTDREILRSCDGCASPHLRLVADRLRVRVDNIREIDRLVRNIESHAWEESVSRIREICKEVE